MRAPQAEVKCPTQRLVQPRTCPQSMVIILPMTLIHVLNVFLPTASVRPHLWPFNSPSWPLLSVSFVGFLFFCPILNVSIPQDFDLEPLSSPMSLLLLGALTHLMASLIIFHSCISDISWTSESYIRLPVRHLHLKFPQKFKINMSETHQFLTPTFFSSRNHHLSKWPLLAKPENHSWCFLLHLCFLKPFQICLLYALTATTLPYVWLKSGRKLWLKTWSQPCLGSNPGSTTY